MGPGIVQRLRGCAVGLEIDQKSQSDEARPLAIDSNYIVQKAEKCNSHFSLLIFGILIKH